MQRLRGALAVVSVSGVVALVAPATDGRAAEPAQGTLTSADETVRWTGGPVSGVNVGADTCVVTNACDEFALDVALPATTWSTPGGLQVGVRWADEEQDVDLYVYGPDGALVAQSAGPASTTESVLLRNAANGRYRVVLAAQLAEDVTYEGIAQVERDAAVEPVRDLLPDLVALAPRNFNFATGAYLTSFGAGSALSCYPEETAEQGARRCLRFDQIVGNTGAGPFELRYRLDGVATDKQLRQRIYRSDGTSHDRVADTYEFHATHAHFHYKNFAVSRLWALSDTGVRLGPDPVRTGDKNGFCMIDVENMRFGETGDAARTYYFPRCNAPTEVEETSVSMVNGISVGWADVYNWFLADQYIEVSGLPDGIYELETIADPAATVVESDETNNLNSVTIRISGDTAERIA